MSQLAIVNAPSSFTAIWAVMRPWLAKETVEKVSVLGSNYATALLKLVDAENLPKSLGGTCTCSDAGPCDSGHAEGPTVGGIGGELDMGRCAYSSAGPWMVGRTERREAWLRGERQIALQPGELKAYFKQAEGEDSEKTAEEHSTDAASADESSESASPGPSTPPLDAVTEQLSGVNIRSDADSERSHPIPGKASVQMVENIPQAEDVAA